MTETKAQRRERERKEYEANQASLVQCNAVSRRDNEKQWATNEAVVEAAKAAVTKALGGFAGRAARAANTQ